MPEILKRFIARCNRLLRWRRSSAPTEDLIPSTEFIEVDSDSPELKAYTSEPVTRLSLTGVSRGRSTFSAKTEASTGAPNTLLLLGVGK